MYLCGITGRPPEAKISKTALGAEKTVPWEYHKQIWRLIDKFKKEKLARKIDPDYRDPYLESIRKREWRRRLRGVWFWNFNPDLGKSELIYITGLHYLYITYWKFQGKFMDFRMPDRDIFYVVEYCMQDTLCLGLNELTKRKNGKCFGKDTPIRMFDGSVKIVQDVYDGEYVMGDDSTKRLVKGAIVMSLIYLH